jgi:hypothetical protein
MSFMDNMMEMMMGTKSKEKKMEMMEKMMPKMMEDMEPEDMMAMMQNMMPKMMESMGEGKTMMKGMHKMMPKMMNHCFSSMKKTEVKKMLTFCRGMLDKMEKKHL